MAQIAESCRATGIQTSFHRWSQSAPETGDLGRLLTELMAEPVSSRSRVARILGYLLHFASTASICMIQHGAVTKHHAWVAEIAEG